MNRTRVFDQQATLVIKGFAIILMVCNHLFPIPEWIYPDNQFISLCIGSKTFAAYFGSFSKICVAIFALLTGIAMYFAYSKNTLGGGYIHTLKKLPVFFTTYWMIILFVYIPIMSIVGVFNFDLQEFLLNLLGYKTTYCKIAWYVRFYLELVLSFPTWVVLYRFLDKVMAIGHTSYPFLALVLIQWGIRIIVSTIQLPGLQFIEEYFRYIPIVMLGYYIGKEDLFSKFALFFSRLPNFVRIVVFTLFLLLCFFARGAVKEIAGFGMDFIYAPLIVFTIWQIMEIIDSNALIMGMSFLGKYSLEIWFLHAIFFIGNSTVQKIGYWPRFSVLILVWVFIILLPFAMIIHKTVDVFMNKIRDIEWRIVK